MDQLDKLREVKLFVMLSDEELGQLSNKVSIRRFKKNDIILYEADTNQFMYVILSGKVKVVQISEEGKETILSMHKAGDFFGEMSLIDGKTMPALVKAAENTVTAIISRKDFFDLMESHKKILVNLLRILCQRVRESWERIQILSFNNASQKIRMLFLFLSNEYGRRLDGDIILNIKLTHQDIADMAGVTRETVTRIIDKMKKDGDITILKNRQIRLNAAFMKHV